MIIIIEDDLALIETYQEQLANERCGELQFFSNPEAALAFYEKLQGGCELIVLDLAMPGMRGEQVLVHMLQSCPEQRIAVLTGDASQLEGSDDSLRLDKFFDVRIYAKPLSVRQILLDYNLVDESSDVRSAVNDYRSLRRAA